MEIARDTRIKRPRGFYITLQDNKYNLIPHQEYRKDAIAFAETTDNVERVLLNVVCSNLVSQNFSNIDEEMDRLCDFPTVHRSLELILSSPFAYETVSNFDMGRTFNPESV